MVEEGFELYFFNRRALLLILFLIWGGCADLHVELKTLTCSIGAMLSTILISLLSKQFQYDCTLSNGMSQFSSLILWIKVSLEYFCQFLLYVNKLI